MPDYEGYYDYIELRRAELPDSARIVADQGFLDRLAALDPQAEVIWNPRREPPTWALYRVVHFGASPADDKLRHEFDIQGAPGDHVIQRMQARQLIRPGGPQDMAAATREFLRQVKERTTKRRKHWDQQWADCMHDVSGNLDAYVRRGKTSDMNTRRKRRNLNPAVRSGSPKIYVPQNIDKVTGTVHQENKPTILIATS